MWVGPFYMRFSPRFLILTPLAGVLLFTGQIQSHKSYAQNPVPAPNPLDNLPTAPQQSGGSTLGGPLGNPAPTKAPVSAPPRVVKPTPVTLPTPLPSVLSKDIVRVGLSTKGGPLQVWLPEGAVLRDLDQPQHVQTVPANSALLFGASAARSEKIGGQTFKGPVSVQTAGRTSYGWSKIAVQPMGGTFARATSNGNSARWGRPYRGSFEVFLQRSPEPNHRKGSLALINVVGMEDYLKGVVPWEMGPSAPLEALKAQAICARTKTLDFKNTGRFASGGFDVCDYDACQGYPGTENEKPSTSQAVEMTKGLALFYGGRPIDAVYSTNSGGVTAAASDVWRGGDVPYLQSVHDFPTSSPLNNLFNGPMNEGKWGQFVSQPFDSFARPDGVSRTQYEARKYRWTQYISVEEATKAFDSQGLGRIISIAVEKRADSGHIRRIKVTAIDPASVKIGLAPASPTNLDSGLAPLDGAAPTSSLKLKSVYVEGDGPIRAMFSKQLGSTTALPSSLFVVTPQTDAKGEVAGWNFTGAGWGHGVGMCQRGAQNHAKDGWDARRILSWYYRGVDIRQQ